MKTLNQTKINFLSLSENESFARTVVSAFVTQLDPTVEEMVEIRTAVSEAVTNCIVHAYKNRTGNIEMSLKILEGNEIYIRMPVAELQISKKLLNHCSPLPRMKKGQGLGFPLWKASWTRCRSEAKPIRVQL